MPVSTFSGAISGQSLKVNKQRSGYDTTENGGEGGWSCHFIMTIACNKIV